MKYFFYSELVGALPALHGDVSRLFGLVNLAIPMGLQRGQLRRQRSCPAALSVAMSVLTAALIYAEPARAGQTVSIEATYTGEIWSNLHGGLKRESVYLDNFDLEATIDAERIGLENTMIAVSALYNNRNTFSESIVGDLQTVSNINTDGSLRLYEAWVERDFGAAAIKVGLIDLNSEFDVNTPGSLFINSSHGIGPDFSQVGETGPSIFPLTGLGVIVRANLGLGLSMRAGLFEGTPGNPDRPRRLALDLDADEGALLVGEVGHRLGEKGRVVLGGWHHTGGRVGPINPDRTDGASTGAYLHVEGPIGTAGDVVIDGFARIGFADADVHQFARYTGAGVTFSGSMLGDEVHKEQIGIAVAVASNGSVFRRVRAVAGNPVDRRETVIELTHRAQLTSHLALQPDLQYILNPGTDPFLRVALAAGLRFELRWGTGN